MRVKDNAKDIGSSATASDVTIQELNEFDDALEKIEKANNPRMNIFRAMGLVNQEMHHSSFFAGLLNPDNSHNLGDAVLRAFLKRLYCYQPKPDGVTKPVPNKSILANQGIKTKDELLALLQGCVSVEKEVPTDIKIGDKKGRMDIVVTIAQSQTVIVIENKTGTTTHDDQLRKYQAEIDAKFGPDYKKIFVYLSPRGELPYNRGGDADGTPNKGYCVFDYEEICEIIRELMEELTAVDNNRFNLNKDGKKILLYGLEEYLDMCETDLLHNNAGKFEKCEEIISSHRAAIGKLLEYLQSPTEENVVKYVAQLITGDTNAGSARMFATQAMKDYFNRNGEEFDIRVIHCYCCPRDSKKFNGYEIFLEIENVHNAAPYKRKWTPVQQKLLDELLAQGMLKKINSNSNRIKSKVHFLSPEDSYKSMDEVKPKIKTQLEKFIAQVQKLDEILKSLTLALKP